MPQVLVNKSGLPQTLVDACAYDSHKSPGDISVTQLIDGPRIRILKKQHTYETDIMENLYMLMGTALHHILERANMTEERKKAFILTAETIMKQSELQKEMGNQPGADELQRAANYIFKLIPVFFPELAQRYILEKTMTITVNGMKLSGTFDLYDRETKTLYDYKFCSVFSYIYPESRKKWKAQTNVYAYMLEEQGFEVENIRIVAFFRDWSEHSLNQNADYPKAQVLEIPIPLGNPNDPQQRPWKLQVASFINDRIALHQRAEAGDIADCTGEDRWAKSDDWAVKKTGGKKALRVFSGASGQKLANDFKIEAQAKYNEPLYVEYRPGDSVKCNKFCPVAQFCDQRKAELKLKETNGE